MENLLPLPASRFLLLPTADYLFRVSIAAL